MGFRHVVFLAVIGTAQAASSQALVKTEIPRPWTMSVSASLGETPVNPRSADHFRIYEISGNFSYNLPWTQQSWLESPKLSLSLGYTDQLSYEDNQSNLTNARLTLSGISLDLGDKLNLNASLQLSLPTNEDDRIYSGFLGSLSVKPSLTWKAFAPVSLTAAMGISQHFYEYTTNKGGRNNPSLRLAPSIGASYSWRSVGLDVGASNYTTYYTDGSQGYDTYAVHMAASYAIDDSTTYGLSWSSNARTFAYDGTTPDINLAYADQSFIDASVTVRL